MTRLPVLLLAGCTGAASHPTGTTGTTGATASTGNTDSAAPFDWSTAPAGDVRTVYTDDEGDNLHSLVTRDGVTWVTFTHPADHALDDIGQLTWSDDAEGRLATAERVARGVPFCEGIDVGPDGAAYSACWFDLAVHRTTDDGADEVFSVGKDNPTNVIFDAAGNLYVTNWYGSTIDRVTTEGKRELWSTHLDYAGPHGMAFDDAGMLYVANFLDGQVFRVDAHGVATPFAVLPFDSRLGHLVWMDGAFYATAPQLNQLFRIAIDGTVEVIAGSGRAGDVDGPALEAELANPNGLLADPERHTLYVGTGSTLREVPLVGPDGR